MRNLLLIITLLICVQSYSQAPQSFKYQATARNNSGDLIINQNVGMQISVLQGSANGMIVYVETFSPNTNEFGLININIGTGSSSNDFSAIDWANGSYFIKIEMDVNGGTNYQDFGTSQLLSVPYALYANNSASSNYSFTPTAPNGFQNIEPVTIELVWGEEYIVPTGKILYILNFYPENTCLEINNIKVACLSLVYLAQPLLADENDILSSDGKAGINGYLIDK